MNTIQRAHRARAVLCLAVGTALSTVAMATGGDVAREQAPPALVAAVRAVWERNAAVQAAEAKVIEAQSLAQAAAKPLYNPELELAVQNADVDTRSIGLAQQVDWSGKRRARAAAADAGTRAVEAERDGVRQSVALDWLRGAAAWQVSQARVALGAERVDLLAQFVALAQKRLRAGDIPVLERDLAELALQEARAQQAELLAEGAKARQALQSVGGVVAELPPMPDAPPAVDTRALPDAALAALPEVRRAEAERETAEARVTVAERDRRPDPTIALTTGRVTDGPFNDRLVGVTVRVPLFVRNDHRAETVAARANAEAAEAGLRDTRTRASAQAEQARESYLALREAWIGWRDSRAARAGDRAALLQKLWEAGELSTADYLVQLRQGLDTELAATGVRARVWQGWADWLAASGGLAAWLDLADVPAASNQDVSR